MKTLHELSAQFNGRFEFSPYKMLSVPGVKITDRKKNTSTVIFTPTKATLVADVEHACLKQLNNEGLK